MGLFRKWPKSVHYVGAQCSSGGWVALVRTQWVQQRSTHCYGASCAFIGDQRFIHRFQLQYNRAQQHLQVPH